MRKEIGVGGGKIKTLTDNSAFIKTVLLSKEFQEFYNSDLFNRNTEMFLALIEGGQTLRQLSLKHHLSGERVRQIYMHFLYKLHHYQNSPNFNKHIEGGAALHLLFN